MIVLNVTACPAGLRGDLTKWLMEIAPGVFVGRPSARIRDALWERTVELCKEGQALMVYSMNNEQGMEFRTHRHKWHPTDFEGLTLIVRPTENGRTDTQESTPRHGWAKARYLRRR